MSKYQAKINILSELLSFPTVRGKDWASVYGDNKAFVGDDDRRRMLTEEVLGECWHGYTDDITPDGQWRMCSCGYAFIRRENHINRTFTSWQDLGDLKKKIVEMGEWDEFIDFTLEEHGSLGPVFSNEAKFYKADYIDWLMNPERFCELVAKWWKERRKG